MIKYLFSQAQPTNCPDGCLTNLPKVNATEGQVQNGLAIVFGVLAAVAVLVIVTAAIDYANSGGEPEKISRAKKTIILALIGLIIAISAEFVVLTVVGRL